MTGAELSAIVQTYSHPISADRRGGVFDLYERVTGVKKTKRCETCLHETLFELRCLVRKYAENEIPLEKPIITIDMVATTTLIKYRIKQPFRVHGSGKIQTEQNTTDDEVELLLRINPKLRGHFERVDGSDVLEFMQPVKVVKTSESVAPAPVSKPHKKKRGK